MRQPLTAEQIYKEADRLIQSSFPGVAKPSRPSRKRKTSDRTSSTRTSSRATGSSRSRKPQYSDMGISLGKIGSVGDAQAWGRTAARLGWGLSSLNDDVDSLVQEYAIAAYERRMIQLHGAPF